MRRKTFISMRILPFPTRHNNKAENYATDWSQADVADFYRAHRLLVENGAGIGIDRGVSDIGEPWMVFFDGASQDVFLHVARIDGHCHLICDSLDLRLSAANINQLITEFENSVRELLSIRAERSKNVVIHPAARIIMSISAIFLLFKLETGEAHAKAQQEKTITAGQEEGTGRLSDKVMASMVRAQAAFARVFESSDAPGYVAVLAGAILVNELSRSADYPAINTTSEAKADELLEHGKAGLPALNAANHIVVSTPESNHSENQASTTQSTMHSEPVTADPTFILSFLLAEASVGLPKIPKVGSDIEIGPETRQTAVMTKNADGSGDVEQANLDKAATSDKENEVAGDTEATKALKEFVAFASGEDWSSASQKDILPTQILSEEPLREISAAQLDTIDDTVGFFIETQYDDAKFYKLMQYFANTMPQYDYDYVTGKVLIEEKNVDALADQNIGLWTNVMVDGSTFSVIGHVGLIDDVVTFFA